MDRFRIAGDQRMPPCEVLAFSHQAVGAGWRQPPEPPDIARREPHAIPYLGMAMGIVAAAARCAVEQLATYVGEQCIISVLINKFVQATAAATVAQTLPLQARHLGHALAAPERGVRVGHIGNPWTNL